MNVSTETISRFKCLIANAMTVNKSLNEMSSFIKLMANWTASPRQILIQTFMHRNKTCLESKNILAPGIK